MYVDSNFDKKIDTGQFSGGILSKPSTIKASTSANFDTFPASKQSFTKSTHRSTVTVDKTMLKSKIKDNYSVDESLNVTFLNAANRSIEKKELVLQNPLSKINNYDTLFGTKFLENVAKCKSFSENVNVKSLKDPQGNGEKARKGFIKAKFSNPVKNEVLSLSNRKFSYSSSSDISETSYLECNYTEKMAACNIGLHNAVCESKSLVDLIYDKTNISKFVTSTGNLNEKFDKGNIIEKWECLKNNVDHVNFPQSFLIKDSLSNSDKQEMCHGKNISKPKKSFLQQLKLKQRARQVERIINEGNGIVGRKFYIGKQSNDSDEVKLESNSSNYMSFYETSQVEVTDCPSDNVSEKEITFYDAIEEIENKEILNNEIEHENAYNFEDVTKNSQQSIKNSHKDNELPTAEISILSVADKTCKCSATFAFYDAFCNVVSMTNISLTLGKILYEANTIHKI